MWWMLAREVLRLRGKIIVESTFFTLDGKTIMPDLYFYRDPEEQKKEEAGEEGEEKRDVFADGTAKPEEVRKERVESKRARNLLISVHDGLGAGHGAAQG